MKSKSILNIVKKTFIFGLLGAITLADVAVTKVSASTQDTDIVNFSVSAFSYTPISGRKKDNTTSVYLYYTEGDNSSIKVRAEGSNSLDGTYANYTLSPGTSGIVSYVTCSIKKQHTIQSLIKESGKSYARLSFLSKNAVLSEKITGKWSPDSTQNYNVAKQ